MTPKSRPEGGVGHRDRFPRVAGEAARDSGESAAVSVVPWTQVAGRVGLDCDGALVVCPSQRSQLCPLVSLGEVLDGPNSEEGWKARFLAF